MAMPHSAAIAASLPHPPPPDWEAIRARFPILARSVHGKPLVYLDSANTSQKPQAVIDATSDFYRRHNANVSRAVHALGAEATAAAPSAGTAAEPPAGARSSSIGTLLAWAARTGLTPA